MMECHNHFNQMNIQLLMHIKKLDLIDCLFDFRYFLVV